MSAITIENDLVHYEVLGRGRPVIFVHGWLGSWRYWVPAMQQLSLKYRTYALDLWGFGDSSKEMGHYGFAEQVKLLYDFMEKLGIAKAALVGHSLGAAICLHFASLHPDRAPRLMLVSTPLYDAGGLDGSPAKPALPSATATPAPLTPTPLTPVATPSAPAITAPPGPDPEATQPIYSPFSETIPRNPLKGLGESPEEILANLRAKNASTTGIVSSTQPMPSVPSSSIPDRPILPTGIATPIQPQPAVTAAPARVDARNKLVEVLTNMEPVTLLAKHTQRDAPDLEKLRAEVSKTDKAAIVKSAQSFEGINLAVDLQKLAALTLLLHGKDDPLLEAPSDELLERIRKGKAENTLLSIVEPELSHFPMLEITAKFNRLLSDFLEAPDLKNVQFKDQWRRTMR